jgi:hypothetical protein
MPLAASIGSTGKLFSRHARGYSPVDDVGVISLIQKLLIIPLADY